MEVEPQAPGQSLQQKCWIPLADFKLPRWWKCAKRGPGDYWRIACQLLPQQVLVNAMAAVEDTSPFADLAPSAKREIAMRIYAELAAEKAKVIDAKPRNPHRKWDGSIWKDSWIYRCTANMRLTACAIAPESAPCYHAPMIPIRNETLRQLTIAVVQLVAISGLYLFLRWFIPQLSGRGMVVFVLTWFPAIFWGLLALPPWLWLGYRLANVINGGMPRRAR
jgi:hypothetical protein